MSTLSQFVGGRGGIKPTGLINGSSSLTRVMFLSEPQWCKKMQTGLQTANVLSTVLSLSGKGVIDFLSVCSGDSTSRTHRIKVTIDGIVIFDATSAAAAAAFHQHVVIGAITAINDTANYSGIVGQPLIFDTSLLIEYASSITETGYSFIYARYTPKA